MSETDDKNIVLTQEQLDNIVKGAVDKALEERAKDKEPEKNIVDDAKQKLAEEQAAKNNNAEMESAIKFNMNIEKFVKDNEKVLPSEAKKIIETIGGRNFGSESEKANNTRKAIIDSFIQLQANIDVLPASQKEAVERYKNLTEEEKVKQSSRFWGIVDVGTTNKVLMRKAEQQRGDSSGNADDFEKRFLEQGKIFRKG